MFKIKEQLKNVNVKETLYSTAKKGVTMGVSLGTGYILNSIIENNSSYEPKKMKRACIKLATGAIVSYASLKISEHVDAKIDEAREGVEELMDNMKNIKEGEDE